MIFDISRGICDFTLYIYTEEYIKSCSYHKEEKTC